MTWLAKRAAFFQRPRAAGRPRTIGGAAAVLLALGLLAALPLSAEKISQLKPEGYVNDFAGVLSAGARARLTALCAELDKKANAQIAIVTVRTLGGVPIEEFSIDLSTRWGIGPKKSDRGLLILIATEDHKYRVEVGYGLEGILPDGRVGGFGREAVPLLRAGNYDGALLLLTYRIADVIAEDRGVNLTSTPAIPRAPAPQQESDWGALLPLLFILGVPMMGWLLPILFLALFGRGRGMRRSGYGGWPWWIGGWGGPIGGGGSWGGGGGGFGGFGGGGFGGGGASGGW